MPEMKTFLSAAPKLPVTASDADKAAAAQKQADEIWEQQIKPMLDAKKPIALIYAANNSQATRLHGANDGGTSPKGIIDGTGQALIFKLLAERIEREKVTDKVHIVPASTSKTGGNNSPPNEVTLDDIKRDLKSIAAHRANGWEIRGLSAGSRYAIGGGASKAWLGTDKVYIISDSTGQYVQKTTPPAAPSGAISQGEYMQRQLERIASSTPEELAALDEKGIDAFFAEALPSSTAAAATPGQTKASPDESTQTHRVKIFLNKDLNSLVLPLEPGTINQDMQDFRARLQQQISAFKKIETRLRELTPQEHSQLPKGWEKVLEIHKKNHQLLVNLLEAAKTPNGPKHGAKFALEALEHSQNAMQATFNNDHNKAVSEFKQANRCIERANTQLPKSKLKFALIALAVVILAVVAVLLFFFCPPAGAVMAVAAKAVAGAAVTASHAVAGAAVTAAHAVAGLATTTGAAMHSTTTAGYAVLGAAATTVTVATVKGIQAIHSRGENKKIEDTYNAIRTAVDKAKERDPTASSAPVVKK